MYGSQQIHFRSQISCNHLALWTTPQDQFAKQISWEVSYVSDFPQSCLLTSFAYLSLYRLPEPVLTTIPPLAPLGTGEVVIRVPLRKLDELLT